MAAVYLSLGSNMGDRQKNLQNAINYISVEIGEVVCCSGVYESQAWGYEGKNFLNMVILVHSGLSPEDLLNRLKMAEKEMGRIRTTCGYEDRCIDLDILFYDDLIIHCQDLVIPHPGIAGRKFVLLPFCDIDPDFIHPVLKVKMKILSDDCSDKGWIRPFPIL